jgi:hypothetical protein
VGLNLQVSGIGDDMAGYRVCRCIPSRLPAHQVSQCLSLVNKLTSDSMGNRGLCLCLGVVPWPIVMVQDVYCLQNKETQSDG